MSQPICITKRETLIAPVAAQKVLHMHQNNAATALAQRSICSCAGPVKAIERTLAEASGDVVSGGNTIF